MVDTGIMASNAAVLFKAGENASVSSSDVSYTNYFIERAEAVINAVGRYDFSTNWGSLQSPAKDLLGEICSSLAAIYVIQYDMSVFTTRTEAEDMINVLRDSAMRGLSLLKDQRVVKFIVGG